jgi:dipeptidyl aminopeptidase/acylaminoacyl peptidase
MRRGVAPIALLVLTLAGPLCCQSPDSAAADERAQITAAAARVRSWQAAVKPFRPAWNWAADGRSVWFEDPRGGPVPFVRVGLDGVPQRVASRAELGLPTEPQPLPPRRVGGRSRRGGGATTLVFDNRSDRAVQLVWIDLRGRDKSYGELEPGARKELSTFAGHLWRADFAAGEPAGVFEAAAFPGLAVLDAEAQQQAVAPAPERPRPPAQLAVRDHQVVVTAADGTEHVLTTDGSASDPYLLPQFWSPDGTKVVGFQERTASTHQLHLIETAPKDQLQPRLHTLPYRKPGQDLEWRRPRLFDLTTRRQVPIDDAQFAFAWAIDELRWSADGRTFYCRYNRRGHQLLQLLAIDAATGAVRVVVEERATTFIDYSQKSYVRWLADGRRLLWTSERDGRNHLYLVDADTGATTQLTRGPWLVREVEYVDDAAGVVWVRAFGFHADQDPYHSHLLKVGLDGAPPIAITTADGSHEWEFGPDRTLVLVRWSRVDHPWVTELRAGSDGRLLAELGRDDVAGALAAGLLPPQRFVAPGRDGATPIHGILTLPSTFDAARRYPVIEDIYAGPHDHFVPKQWGIEGRTRELAELGFVVVQIDGMGTNWRDKAFHDVCWRNLKDSGFPDRIAWLRAAAATRPWLDLDRVGIFGGSAGGQSALAALLHHGDFYDVAVADCGCHDNRMDKIWWNEAWMGWPLGPWYADSSNVTHAPKLRGALLLTVGELDRNVDPASTMQVVKALIEADRDFELLVAPGGGHGVGESPYFDRRRKQFFRRHLLTEK